MNAAWSFLTRTPVKTPSLVVIQATTEDAGIIAIIRFFHVKRWKFELLLLVERNCGTQSPNIVHLISKNRLLYIPLHRTCDVPNICSTGLNTIQPP